MGGKHWEAVVTPGRSCRRAGVHIKHNANSGNSGDSGGQEYELDRDSLQTQDSGRGRNHQQQDQAKSVTESLSLVTALITLLNHQVTYHTKHNKYI